MAFYLDLLKGPAMPTTSYVSTMMSAAAVGARTDAAGAAVADLTAEEARLANAIVTTGYLTGPAFFVAQQAAPDMTVRVGSQNAKVDLYALSGSVPGQGNYLVRLDSVGVTVSIDAADSSQNRVDEVYLVVRDNAYDSSGLVTPQIAYRKGDVGGAVPGADSTWRASALLAQVNVPAAATSITQARIVDRRNPAGLAAALVSSLASSYVSRLGYTAKGDLMVATGLGAPARLPVGAAAQVLRADPDAEAGVAWSDIGVTKVGVVRFQETSSSTATKDIGLSATSDLFTITMPAGSHWVVEYFVPHFRSGSARLVFGWGKSASVGGFYSVVGSVSAGTAAAGDIDYRASSLDDQRYTIGAGPSGEYAQAHITVTAYNDGSTSGVLGLQFGSDTNGTPVYIGRGAVMRAVRVR